MASPPKCVTNTFDSKGGVQPTCKEILRLVDRFNRKYSKWNDYNAGRRCYQSRQGWDLGGIRLQDVTHALSDLGSISWSD